MKKLRKNLIKPFITLIAILSVAINFNVFASAETVYTNTKDTRIASTPTKDNRPSIGGFSIEKGINRMYVVKSNRENEVHANFYYYPDINNPSKFAIFKLENAGHANSMAIDNNYIYVSAWGKENKRSNIIRIAKNTIKTMKFSQNREKIDNYDILKTYYKTYNQSTKNYTYSLTTEISAITNYNNSGTFITRSTLPNGEKSSDYFIYSMAKIEKYDGKDALIVERSENSTFLVKDNFDEKGRLGQDIYYLPSNGSLYIPRWYKNRKCKNIIAWVHLKGSYSKVSINGFNYKCYTPDKININKTNQKSLGKKMYDKYEVESIAFTKNNDLLYSCNVDINENYRVAYHNKYKNNPPADGIFKLTKSNGGKFIWLLKKIYYNKINQFVKKDQIYEKNN